jgi:sugar phosphate isomerase/epimerase
MQGEVTIKLSRYITYINPSHPKEEWSFADEQRMFDLHNDLGNKWAVIGAKLAGR